LQALLARVKREKLGEIRRAPEIATASGKRVEMWVADALTDIDPVAGADNLSVDLNLEIFTGHPDENPRREGGMQITIWDGQTFAHAEPIGKGKKTRLIFFTGRVINPDGKPANPELHSVDPFDPFDR